MKSNVHIRDKAMNIREELQRFSGSAANLRFNDIDVNGNSIVPESWDRGGFSL